MDKTGIEIITEERKRQIEVEGWTLQHDIEEHFVDELATVGALYALPESQRNINNEGVLKIFPWDNGWWKPTPDDRIRELAKAGALIAAEIDRILNQKIHV